MSEVLIVGAGPTGLALGCELLRRNIPVRLIDDDTHLSAHSKALGIQSRTLEMFEKLGIIEQILAHGRIHYFLKIKHLDKITQIALKNLDAPYPFLLILPQAKTEEILFQKFQELGGKIEWKTKLLSLNGWEALIEHDDGRKESYKPDWVVGCDGAHSAVRHGLNLTFKGARFSEIFLIADVIVDTAMDTPHVLFDRKGIAMVIPMPETDHGFRLVIPVEKKLEEPLTTTLYEKIIKERGITEPFTVKEILWSSEFHIHRRIVERMKVKNVFLAGDASHLHSPIGGQGMNTSVQDALNLAWKLELVIKGAAPESLLDTYQAERHPVAKKVLRGTTFATQFLTFGRKIAPGFFYWILNTVAKHKQKMIANAMSELSVNYRGSSIVCEPKRDKNWKGPKAGERAPDGKLADGKRLFELLKSTRHVLLFFKQDPLIEKIKQEYGEWIDVYLIEGEDIFNKYHAGPESLYLIRPDGCVGYRSQHFKAEEFLDYLQNIIKLSSRSKS